MIIKVLLAEKKKTLKANFSGEKNGCEKEFQVALINIVQSFVIGNIKFLILQGFSSL